MDETMDYGGERRKERSEDEDEYRSIGEYSSRVVQQGNKAITGYDGEIRETVDWDREEKGGNGMDEEENGKSGEESWREASPPPKRRKSDRLKSTRK